MRNIFIVFALAVIGGAGYLLYLDLHQGEKTPVQQSQSQNQGKEALGLVQTSRNNSKRQPFGSQELVTLAIGAEIFSQDTLRTGTDSDTSIKLASGAVVEVGAESTVYVERAGAGILVILKAGQISVEGATSATQFSTRGATMSGSGAFFQMTTDGVGKSQVLEQKAQSTLVDKNKKYVTLDENNVADLNDGVLVGVQNKPGAFHAPVPVITQQRSQVVPAAPVTASLTNNKKVLTKPTPPKDLKKIATPSPSPSPSSSPSPSPSPSPSSQEKQATFLIISPKDQATIVRDLTLENPEPIVFQWKVTKTLPGPLVLTVSHDPQFSDPIVVNNLKKTSTPVTLKKDGIYYWNLSSQSADGSGLEISPALTFDLKSAGALTAPSPISPKNSEQIETQDPKQIKFMWKASKNATEYHITVKRTDAASKEQFIVVDQDLTATEFTSDPLENGLYTWNVTAKDGKNRTKNFSHDLTFNIAAPFQMAPPKLKEPVVK